MATSKLSLKLKTDSGSSSTDLYTKSGTLAVSGQLTGDTVWYRYVSADGTYSAWTTTTGTIPAPGSDGVWTIEVKEVSKAGSIVATKSLTFTLDRVVTAPVVGLQTDTGASASDNISNLGQLKVVAETGAKIEYSLNAGKTWMTSFAAVEGANTVLVRQTDKAGNVSASTKYSFTVDTKAGLAPTVKLAVDSSDGGTGHATDLVTNNGTLAVSGAEAGASLQYSLDGSTWTGAFTATEGANAVWVRQVDVAGNASAASKLVFTLDTQAEAPVVGLASDSGYDGDGLTNDATLDVTGVEAGATVLYSLDGTTWTDSVLLAEGSNTVMVEQIDAAGNVSAVSELVFTLDETGPDAATDAFSTSADTPVTFYDGDLLWNDSDAVSGWVELAGIDGVSANGGSIVADGMGGYTYQAAADFTGTDSFTYQVVDGAGNLVSGLVTIDVAAGNGGGDTGGGGTGGGGGWTAGDPFRTYDAAIDQNSALINALLATDSGIVVDAASVNLHESGYGATNFYDGSLTPLSIGSGLLITSGTKPGTTNTVEWFGQDNGGAWDPNTGDYLTYNGDADLNTVVNQVFSTTSYDATTLSFDFTVTDPTATSVAFNLVFGSDEYPEWVDQFVDCAIVLVNGVNVALFNHDAMAPLSVIGSNLSAGYFQDNQTGSFPIEYDGVSKMLTIVAPIHSGTNTIKIGIGDTGDHIYDSGIFLAGLRAGNLPGSGVLIEDTSTTTGDDSVSGGATSDLVDCGSGNDTVSGGGGDDIIDGGSGNDVIGGGSGADTLTGGAGADEFDYTSVDDWAVYDGFDNITDFTANTLVLANASNTDALNGDVLEFSLATLQQLAGVDWAAEQAPAAGYFATLDAGYVSTCNDGTADQAHGQFVYDSTTGIVGFDADGTGSGAAVEITLLGSHPDALVGTAFVVVG